jgi:hypothetical protein
VRQPLTVRERLDDWLSQREESVTLAEGFEEALIGVAQVFNTLIAIYDRDRCITALMTGSDMTRDDAEEFFEFNCQGAYVGEQTPGFLVWRVDEGREQ